MRNYPHTLPFCTGLAAQAASCIRQSLQASSIDPGTTHLAKTIGPIAELVQSLLDLFQRGLNLALKRHAYSLLKGLGAIVGNVIAVTDAFVLGSL
jgi:hypothetical protein